MDFFEKRILNHYAEHGFGLFAVILKHDQSFIGFVGLINQTIDGESKIELGYRLFPRYWGKGLATEAAEAVCQFAFDEVGAEEVISIIDPQNLRSLEVAKRVQMSFWKDSIFHNIPVKIYALKRPLNN